MIVMEMTGKTILLALEHAVEGLPGFPGSFLSVSGIRYTFDINKSPRVQEVYINNHLLNENKKYMVALNSYISSGGDGFEMFKECKVIIDQIAAIDLLRLILKFFKGINKEKGHRKINELSKVGIKKEIDE